MSERSNVLRFPEPTPRTCFTCAHVGFTPNGGSYCLLFDEPIDSEIQAAKDCNGYEEAED